MNSVTIKLFIGISITFIGFLWSCSEDKDEPEPSINDYSSGVFVVNEGSFGSGSGTLTFIRRDGTGLVLKAYQKANSQKLLGNVVQSMNVIGDSAFIVVNNSNRIVICNRSSMKEIATIENIYQPRYLVNLLNGNFAVSCWDHTVKIFDLESLNQVDEIATGKGPEKMLLTGEQLWILNTGGLTIDSSITIVNLQNSAVQNLQVYPRPTGIQKDNEGNLWVMCSGRKDYQQGGFSPSHLLCINPETLDFIADVLISEGTHDAFDLEINHEGNKLYYLFKGDVYSIEALIPSTAGSLFIDYTGSYYSLGYDPLENTLYASDVLDYMQNGLMYKFDAASGAFLLSFHAGIIPGEFYFSNE